MIAQQYQHSFQTHGRARTFPGGPTWRGLGTAPRGTLGAPNIAAPLRLKIAIAMAEKSRHLFTAVSQAQGGCRCLRFSHFSENSRRLWMSEIPCRKGLGHCPARKTAAGKSAPPSGTLLDFLVRDRHSLLGSSDFLGHPFFENLGGEKPLEKCKRNI